VRQAAGGIRCGASSSRPVLRRPTTSNTIRKISAPVIGFEWVVAARRSISTASCLSKGISAQSSRAKQTGSWPDKGQAALMPRTGQRRRVKVFERTLCCATTSSMSSIYFPRTRQAAQVTPDRQAGARAARPFKQEPCSRWQTKSV